MEQPRRWNVDPTARRSRARVSRRQLFWRDQVGDRLVAVAARTGVTPRAVVGLLVVGTVIVAVLAFRLVEAEHGSRPVPLRMTAATGSAGAPTAAVTASASTGSTRVVGGVAAAVGTSSTPTASATIVMVHIVGQVRHPGVVRLPAGSRVEQALEAAGGATSTADLARVNLARPVVDGEQIVVPKPGQPIEGAAGSLSGPAATGSGGATAGPVNLNTAGLAELDTLPGVGPVLAQRILDWRSHNGRFSSVDELGEVSGIGEKVLENLRPLVRL